MSTRAPRRSGGRQFAYNAASSWGVNVFKTLLQVGILPVMARLLGPTAYGTYALALPTVLFFVLLADGGFGTSLAREDEGNRVVWSTAFWVLLASCSVMAVGVAGSGFILAWMSGQPSLIGIMAFLSLALPILAVSQPAEARLFRRGNLMVTSGGDLAAAVVGVGVALVLAIQGAGAWSLAGQYVAAFATRALILNWAAWSPPDLVFDLSALRGHLSTSGAIVVGRLGELVGKLAENAVFGAIFGTATLGTYTLANQISRFACEAVTNPMNGSFYAYVLRETPEATALMQAKLNRGMLMILLPATALLAVAAPEAFPLVLGPKWGEAAPIFQCLVVPYALMSISNLGGYLLLRHGMAMRSTKVTLLGTVLRVACVAAGIWTTPVAVAWMVGAVYLLQALLMIVALPTGLGASHRALLSGVWLPTAASLVSAAFTALLLRYTPDQIGSMMLAAVAGVAVYVAFLLWFGGRTLRTEIGSLTRLLRGRMAAR